ncbi:nucleotide-binding universal stress UspA family protein [Aneurinibacillus soli]|uniref:Stress response protein NhaX n=1 Tax=Aneurinibacillus soli TaxID=1500254 RepID=A0A0U5AUF1_9BACL|nr:universal stress protein [Aneurinibacillus soli]PYE63706.1 nucleotide-binding universal stress UspA family protein [Aneurinibacillus soli]BAU27361.1 Stress response protein NhaX [Aneurinibacillus soli]
MFTKIVVAIDGSEMGAKALEAAIALSAEQKAELAILHVARETIVSPYIVGEMAYLTKDFDTSVNEAIRKEAEKLLEESKEKAVARGITAQTVYVTGDPAREIVQYAQENRVGLVVLGSRGLGAFKEMMLGSVSHKVSQLVSCPILIVK